MALGIVLSGVSAPITYYSYTGTVSATGGTPPYVFSLDTSFPIAAGYSMNAGGTITGSNNTLVGGVVNFIVVDNTAGTATQFAVFANIDTVLTEPGSYGGPYALSTTTLATCTSFALTGWMPNGSVTTQYTTGGLLFNLGSNPTGEFHDGGGTGVLAWGGITSSQTNCGYTGTAIMDLWTDVYVSVVYPGGTNLTSCTQISVEAGLAANGSLTLLCYNSGGTLIGTATNTSATLGPHGRNQITVTDTATRIAKFQVRQNGTSTVGGAGGLDTFGMNGVTIGGAAPLGTETLTCPCLTPNTMQVGVAYAGTLAVTGGSGTYTFQVII